jgi:hypothetical protein
MRLTIVIEDKSVYVDTDVFTNLDLSGCGIPDNIHALQWFDVEGWIEYKFNEQPNQTITQLPAWANNCVAVWDVAYQNKINPPPPPPPTAEANKQWASELLYQTDWTTIPDVSDPTKSNPYLGNVDEFITYRNYVRQYAINPVAGNIDWGTVPTAVWVTV